MKIEQLYYLKKIVETGSFTLAAEQSFISQQSLSEAVARIEREYNFKIFIRSRKGVRLTEQGEKFMQDVDVLLAQYEYIRRTYGDGQPKQLRICASFVATELCWQETIVAFNKRYPEVALKIYERSDLNQILQDVNELRYDLALMAIPCELWKNLKQFNNVKVDTLLYDNFCLLVAPEHPFAQKKSITLAECLKEPLILENNHLVKNYILDYYIERYQLTKNYHVMMEVNGPSNSNSLLKKCLAVSFSFQKLNNKLEGFVTIPVKEFDPIPICWVMPKKIDEKGGVRQFKTLLQEQLQQTMPYLLLDDKDS